MFMSTVFSLLSLVAWGLGAPVAQRDVADPPITEPTAGTVWHTGEKQTVAWSTANLPANISNPNGMLVLGYLSGGSENLMLDSPLATNINYTDGNVQITVPNVPTRNDYIVVLFGDSGNASPEFTIINTASGSESATATATTSLSSTPGATPVPTSSPITTPTFSSAPPGSSPSALGSTESPSAGSGSEGTAIATTTIPGHGSTSITVSVVTQTTSTTPSPTQTSAARPRYIISVYLPPFLLASLIFVL